DDAYNDDSQYENYGSTIFKAAAPMSDIIKESESKKQLINRMNAYGTEIANGTFLKASIARQRPNKRIIMNFSALSTCNEFCSSSHTSIAIENKDVPTFHPYDPKAIMLDHNSKTILVTDIPLDAKETSI